MQPATLLLFVTASLAAPPRVLYDQRQEGKWNVLADLKNFVIMVIPTESSSSTSSPTNTLLDFLVRSIPRRSQFKEATEKKAVQGEETMHFIESKTAPYHVDISRSKSHLAKLHPETPVVNAEEIVIAKSPTIELVKDEPRARVTRAFVVSAPLEEKKEKNKEEKKKTKETSKSMMKLLGAENEQCGPGLARDSEGVCRTIKN